MKKQIELKDVVVMLKNQLQDFSDLPQSIVEKTKENDKLFSLIIDITIILLDLIEDKILSETKIIFLIEEFNDKLNYILSATVNRTKITEVLNYIHNKIDETLKLSIHFQLYECSENIKNLIQLMFTNIICQQ